MSALSRTLSQERLGGLFGTEQVVDIHAHLLPGLDDGPRDLMQALVLCKSLAENGVTCAIATPHQLGRYDGRNSPVEVRQAVAELAGHLEQAGIPLQIYPGADVRIDERLGMLLDQDQVSTLADNGKHLLLELPHELLVDMGQMIDQLIGRGIVPVLSHPERHPGLHGRTNLLRAWVHQGVVLQITAGSLLGEFGSKAEAAAWEWLGMGLASLVATDAHSSVGHRRPVFAEAAEAISSRLSYVIARRACIENPLHLLNGRPLSMRLPVRPRSLAL